MPTRSRSVPGLSTHDETADLVRRLVRDCPVPFVLDADGLNAFAGRAAEIADRKSDAILTPHVGEFVRLSGVSARALVDDRLAHVRALAERTDAVTLLKGSRTLVATPDGVVRINPTGGPVLATAGSGDVLTGIIGGLAGSRPRSVGCGVRRRVRPRPRRDPGRPVVGRGDARRRHRAPRAGGREPDPGGRVSGLPSHVGRGRPGGDPPQRPRAEAGRTRSSWPW